MKKDFQTKKNRLAKAKRPSLRQFFENQREEMLIRKGYAGKLEKIVVLESATGKRKRRLRVESAAEGDEASSELIKLICYDLLVRFASGGIPVREAESMVIGIEWYLESVIRKVS